jgi:hypothetical protein
MGKHEQEHRTEPKPQEEKKHPEGWERDLSPNRMQGQNIGPRHLEGHNRRTAADIKELTQTLSEFHHDELKDIPIVPIGTRLEQGAVYLDLRNSPRIVRATAEMVAQNENLYVPKAEIPYVIWNRLLATVGLEPNSESAPAKTEQGKQKDQPPEELIDKASADSFPTSDPPSWTTGRGKESEASGGETSDKTKKNH